MGEAHSSAGEHEDAANPKWRGLFPLRSLVEVGVPNENLQGNQEQGGCRKSNEGRNDKPEADFRGLGPVDAFGNRVAWADEGISNADSNDRSDERVRARRRQAKPPCAEIPDDG